MSDQPYRLPIPPPAIALIAIILTFIGDWLFPALALDFPGRRIIGILPILAFFPLAVPAVRSFKNAGTTDRPWDIEKSSALVTEGVYRISRNPMYLGAALVVLGAGLLIGTWLSLVATAAFVWVVTVGQIYAEEAMLEDKFGDEFRSFKTRTRRWI